MGHRRATEGRRVLICAPYGRDGESLAELLARQDYDVAQAPTLTTLTQKLDDATGAVLMTEEALGSGLTAFQAWLGAQPAWSDLPVLLLCKRQTGAHRSASLATLSAFATNIVVLERPLGSESLLTAIDSALRGRQRQFETGRRIDELHASQTALRASEAELKTVTDALPMLVAFVGQDRRYQFANRAYIDWFGIEAAEVLGRDVAEIAAEAFQAEDYEARRDGVRRALAGERVTLQRPWPTAGGARREAEIQYLPRRASDGQVDGFHVFVQDVTVRVEAEEVLRDTAEALEQRVQDRTAALQAEMDARADAEDALRQAQKMEAVGQLTGGIAHDFNNMLTGVLGSLSIIRRRVAEGRTEDLDRFMDAASTSAERAAALTQRLLAFSRRQSLHAQATEVGDLVRSLTELFERALNENVHLVLDLPEDPVLALVDPHQLENALLNLVINARDAMPAGGIVTVGARAVETGLADTPTLNAGHVALWVSDTGVGIAPEIVDKVFEPFFTTKPIGQGTGLGLSMVFGFVQQSGGRVRIETTQDRGTTIHLHLPQGDSEPVPSGTLIPAAVPEGVGQTVLFVEDDPSVRLVIHEVLDELGFDALEAADPEAALAILRSDQPISLMVTDVGLPGMNGRQLADIARADRPGLPILFVTGYAENAAMRADFLGTNMAMITKPFSIDGLARRIDDVLSMSAGQRDSPSI